MQKYRDKLLLEFLMFSKEIDKEILDFSDSLLQMDINSIYELVENIEEGNIYTKHNIDNLIKVVKFLKSNLGEYENIMYTLLSVVPSYDIYYNEYLNKWNVLESSIEYNYNSVPTKLIEDSIRFDYYAFSTFFVSPNDYISKFLRNLYHNNLYLLFVNKLLKEYPDAVLEPIVQKRISSILQFNIDTIENEDAIKENKRLLNQVKYFAKNKKAKVYDYEKFEYYKNKSFVEYLITSDADLEKYHDYLISDKFITFLNMLMTKDEKEELSYNTSMIYNLKNLLSYILNYRQDNWYKNIYNMLLFRINDCKGKNEIDFYLNEIFDRKGIVKGFMISMEGLLNIMNKINLSVCADYYIFETYSLPEEYFDQMLDSIDEEYYKLWFSKMKSLHPDFFRNEILKRRTIKILETLEQKSNDKKDIQKIKKKINKMNKELEY